MALILDKTITRDSTNTIDSNTNYYDLNTKASNTLDLIVATTEANALTEETYVNNSNAALDTKMAEIVTAGSVGAYTTTVTDKKDLDIVKSNRLGSGSTKYLKGKGDVITETASTFISKVDVDNRYVDMGGVIVDTTLQTEYNVAKGGIEIDYSTGNRDDNSSFVPEVTVQDQENDGLVTTADVYAGDFVAVDRELNEWNRFNSDSDGWLPQTATETVTWNAGGHIDIARNGGSSNTAKKAFSLLNGVTYTLSVDVIALTADMQFYVHLASGTVASSPTSTTGVETFEFTSNESGDVEVSIGATGSSGATLSADNFYITSNINEIYQATEDTTTGTSLLDAKFRVRDNYGISNQIIACHKQNATTKEYLGIHKEIAFVDFEAGQYRKGMLDNGFSEVESGLYSKDGFNYVFIGVWQTDNLGAKHMDFNFFGKGLKGTNQGLANGATSVADCFVGQTGGTIASGVSGDADGTYADIVYPNKFIYAPDYSKLPDELTRKRMEQNLEGADEGVSELVSIVDTIDLTGWGIVKIGTTRLKISSTGNAHIDKIFNQVSGGTGALLVGDEFKFMVKGDTRQLEVVKTQFTGTTYYLYIKDYSGTGDEYLEMTTTVGSTALITTHTPSLSQGSQLNTQLFGNPDNYSQIILDKLAESKACNFEANLIDDEGNNNLPNGTKTSFKVNGKMKENYQVLQSVDGTTWTTPTFTVDLVANTINFGTAPLATDIFFISNDTNNNPAIKSDPLPMLTVQDKVVMSNSHSLYKGAAVGNMNGKIQVGNGARGFESKTLENEILHTYDYVALNGSSNYITIGDEVLNLMVDNVAVAVGEIGHVYKRGTSSFQSSINNLDFGSVHWTDQGAYLQPTNSTPTLSTSASPANKWFTGYAYDENGIEYRTYNIQEMIDAGAGVYNTTEFDNLTNGTTLDDVGTTVDTGYHAVPTGFKKGSK